jgi:hypothetical protein
MAPKPLSHIALATFVSLALWIPLMLLHQISLGSFANPSELVETASHLSGLHYVNYLNALALTILDAALLYGLYQYFKKEIPALGLVAVGVVPVYTTLNVFAYGSQITVLPILVSASAAAPDNLTYQTLIAEFIQYGGGIVSSLNGYAYALLGVPSVIFALPLLKKRGLGTWAGVLLISNAVPCVLSLIGEVAQISVFSWGIVFGGILWTAAVFILWRYFKMEAAAS